jgi:signal transduction histidine kinase
MVWRLRRIFRRRRRGDAAAAVAAIEAAVRRGRDPDEVLTLLAQRAAQVVGAEAVTAMTVEGGVDLVVRAAAGAPVARLSGARIAGADTVAILAVRLRRTYRTDLASARHRFPYETVLARRGLRRVLYAPIPGDGRAAGVIGVGRTSRGRFGVREQDLVELFAGLAAGALRQPPAAERLARELHDSLAQSLYGISLRARAAQELLTRDPAEAGEPLEQVLEIAANGLAETRGLIVDLRPDTLSGDGLVVALRRLLDTLRSGYGTSTSAQLAVAVPAGPAARHALYRIAQEALQNAARHAAAARIAVRLYREKPVVVLEIEDDGRGFDPAAEFAGRLGLRSMRERAEAAGGRLHVRSSPGRGTVVRAEIPETATV